LQKQAPLLEFSIIFMNLPYTQLSSCLTRNLASIAIRLIIRIYDKIQMRLTRGINMPLAENGIWYADHRDPTVHRTPVLLIHGAGGTHLDWPAELRRMPDMNAIAPDLPGHGRSKAPARASISAYAADMTGLLDTLKIPKAILLGHSMGGAIVQTMALHAPDHVVGLILIGTGAKLGVHPDILNGLVSDYEKTIRMIVDWQWADGYEQVKRLGAKRLLETDPKVLLGDFTATNAFDMRGQVGQIGVPTLIIGGTADRMTPFKFSTYLHEQIAGSQLVSVEGGGHMMALEQPQVVANAIRHWLESIH
jgi:pimeloyl-ACP methyl ester carboxylesterase